MPARDPRPTRSNILESLEPLGVFAPRSRHRFDPTNAVALFNGVNDAHKFRHAAAFGDALDALARKLRVGVIDPLARDGVATALSNFRGNKLAIRLRHAGSIQGGKLVRIFLACAGRGLVERNPIAGGDLVHERIKLSSRGLVVGLLVIGAVSGRRCA